MANTKEKEVLLGKVELRRSGRRDPYTLQYGRFVGHDGFVVPKDFNEFYERFPQYVFRWVRKRLNTRMYAEAEDWTQELLLHLSCLPPDSKHRKEGKTDVIQTFDPARMYGANEARFRSYLNRCLTNKFNTLFASWRNKPQFGVRNLSLRNDPNESITAPDEYCHEQSHQLRETERRRREHNEHSQRLREFERYAEKRSPGSGSLIQAFRTTGTWQDAASLLCIGDSDCNLVRYRLRRLGTDFLRLTEGMAFRNNGRDH